MRALFGWLPATRNQLRKQKEELMSHADDRLHIWSQHAERIADRAEAAFAELRDQIGKGKPSAEAVAAMDAALARLHHLVPESEAELETEPENAEETE